MNTCGYPRRLIQGCVSAWKTEKAKSRNNLNEPSASQWLEGNQPFPAWMGRWRTLQQVFPRIKPLISVEATRPFMLKQDEAGLCGTTAPMAGCLIFATPFSAARPETREMLPSRPGGGRQQLERWSCDVERWAVFGSFKASKPIYTSNESAFVLNSANEMLLTITPKGIVS